MTTITAQDLQKILSILERFEKMTLQQAVDTAFMNSLRTDAMFAAIPPKVALGMTRVEVITEKTFPQEA